MEVSARTRNAILTAFGVIAAIVLVAVASRGSTSLGDNTTRKPSDALTDILFALYLVALIGGAVMFVYLLVLQRKVKVQSGKAPPRSLRQMLGTMLDPRRGRRPDGTAAVHLAAADAGRARGGDRAGAVDPGRHHDAADLGLVRLRVSRGFRS